ncbi:MAG: glycosyltransferase [Bacteroidales bacterium]|jgi:glycosyltransferase involved in cell wall biosynthesis|nr:glycosyltransferase [Bacteroidales bacterium]
MKGDNKAIPLVSVVCITYNQEHYIGQALDSFISQKTDFPFECIISDDCSTDETANIIKEYQEKYPEKIKVIYRLKNIGIIENFIDTLAHAHGKYMVYNEGDDYFSDPLKLQKQVDFLEAHPECAICFHPVQVVVEGKSKCKEIFPSADMRFNKTMLELTDLLMQNFIQTNSAMYRWRFNDKQIADVFPRSIMPLDWYLHLLHAQNGSIGFIEDVMSVYRRHPGGIWWDVDGDIEKLYLKYGIFAFNFFHQVYKNITSYPEAYLASTVIPQFSNFINTLIKYHRTEEIKLACLEFPEYVTSLLILKNGQLHKEKIIINQLTHSVSYRLVKKIISNRIFKTCYLSLKHNWKKFRGLDR